MSGLLSLFGWSFLPISIVSGFLQSLYYSLTIRAGAPKPVSGTPRFAEHRRRIHILVVTLYLGYTIYEAYYDLRRVASFYEDLGVLPSATERDIKARFRRLAAVNHPDKAGNGAAQQEAATLRFVHLKMAADTLLDPARRFAYDRFGPSSVAWAADASSSVADNLTAGRCSTIYDFVVRGVQRLMPYYAMAGIALYMFGFFGNVTWGRHERWLVLASVLAFELHTITRPAHPRILTHALNPLLALLARVRHIDGSGSYAPLLPFQAIALARKLSTTAYLGFSQIGPMLGADTRSGKIVPQSSTSAGSSGDADSDATLTAALDQLDAMGQSLDADATRLLDMEMAPFVGHDDVLRNVHGKVKEWLVQNTIRADPMVRDAVGRSLQRRRADAPAGARGMR